MLDIQNFIDGSFTQAIDGESLDDFNPATAQCIATIPRSQSADVELAVSAAQSAQPAWTALTLEQRAVWLDRIADALEEKTEHIARTESIDTGKPIALARKVDAARSCLLYTSPSPRDS